MPPITETGNPPPVQPPTSGGHGGHAAGASANTGTSFADTLAQAIGQAPGGASHAGHGGGAEGASQSGGHGGGHAASLSPPSSDPHPGHIPIGGMGHGAEHHVQDTALGLRAYRQQLIASNIANADTPGYKAVDIDFQEAMQIAQAAAQMPPMTLTTTAAGHIAGQATFSTPPYPLKYRVPSQDSADGNTVEMDAERTKFSENTVMYQFSLDRVSGHFKMLMELYQNLK